MKITTAWILNKDGKWEWAGYEKPVKRIIIRKPRKTIFVRAKETREYQSNPIVCKDNRVEHVIVAIILGVILVFCPPLGMAAVIACFAYSIFNPLRY